MRKIRKIAVAVTWYGCGAHIIQGVHRFSKEHLHWLLHLAHSDSSLTPDNLGKYRPDGVISQILDAGDGPQSCSFECPWVSVLAKPFDNAVPYVAPDEKLVSRLAAEYYSKRNFKNFAFIGNGDYGFSIQRAEAFDAAVKAAGFTCSTHLYAAGILKKSTRTRNASMQRTLLWLQNLPKPVAVFACDDWEAFSLIQFCRIHGFRVPEEVAVMGVNNDELLCNVSTPPLSSIRIPFEQIGYNAAALLEKMLNGKNVSREHFVSGVTLVSRGSTDVLQTEDPVVGAALLFIQNHLADPVHVSDVLKHVRVSKTLLVQKFRAELGRSPLEEIRRQRIQRAEEMLADTALPLSEIAEACGFSDNFRLSTVFKEVTGISPSEFRQTVNQQFALRRVAKTTK